MMMSSNIFFLKVVVVVAVAHFSFNCLIRNSYLRINLNDFSLRRKFSSLSLCFVLVDQSNESQQEIKKEELP